MPMVFFLALLIGAVAGLRTFVAPAAVSWAAHLGWLRLDDSPLAFMGYAWTPWILTALVLIEFVADQLPATPRRTVPVQFGARILSAAVSGAALGAPLGLLLPGLVAGVVGAVIGTFAGLAGRTKLADGFRSDMPAAFIEDTVALLAAALIVWGLR
jgi:uncharacterized membrane protein